MVVKHAPLTSHWEWSAWAVVCICVCVWLTVSYCANQQVWTAGMCVVSCEYIYFRGPDGEERHTPGRKRQREKETAFRATQHSDWVQPIIQYHEGAGTPGIDSQVKGEQYAHPLHLLTTSQRSCSAYSFFTLLQKILKNDHVIQSGTVPDIQQLYVVLKHNDAFTFVISELK